MIERTVQLLFVLVPNCRLRYRESGAQRTLPR
jgi:hypothetical protein